MFELLNDKIELVSTDPFLLFFGSFCLVLGFSCFFAREAWTDFMTLLSKNESLSLVMGVLLLPVGLFVVVFYKNWDTLGSTVLMVLGYMTLVKSFVLLLKPGLVQKYMKLAFVQKWLWLDGISGIALGAAMLML